MLQLRNTTPFAAIITLFPDRQGVDTLYLVVKATFDLHPALAVAERQTPPFLADVYWREPARSSLKYASESHIGKPGTDIVVLGQAWPPKGGTIPQLDVGIEVADKRKIVRVFGHREWRDRGSSITSPQPFERMAIVYEKAYGGARELADGTLGAEPRNPVGTGFVGDAKGQDIDGLPLPNVEDPETLIRTPKDAPPPAGCRGR